MKEIIKIMPLVSFLVLGITKSWHNFSDEGEDAPMYCKTSYITVIHTSVWLLVRQALSLKYKFKKGLGLRIEIWVWLGSRFCLG